MNGSAISFLSSTLGSMVKSTEMIDFVIPWVDGSDPEWRAEKALYLGSSMGIEDGDARYRDWGLLRYWFRGVEKFAPWVRKVHFVTWGHLPEWLNTDHPKLNIVYHEDYIPKKYLPTFSANTIELNLHRIPNIAEHFVYFNDDTFLINDVRQRDFFINGMPRYTAVATPLKVGYDDWFFMSIVDNAVINHHFNFHNSVLSHPLKWFNPRYGIHTMRTISVLPYPYFCGIMEFHLPNAFTKSAFEEVWEAEGELLDRTCNNKTRSTLDVNQYLIKNWMIAKGDFYPLRASFGQTFQFRKNSDITLAKLARYIKQGKGKTVCINDSALMDNIEMVMISCQNILEELLPMRSSFEKADMR